MSLSVKTLGKTDIDSQELAAIAWAAQQAGVPAQDGSEDKTLRDIARGIADDCYQWVFAAYDGDRLAGWLAFYEMSNSKIAQIWDWHPAVRVGEQAGSAATALIQAAFSHLREIGLRQVTVDFFVDPRSLARLDRYLDWYAQCGLAEVIEEERYQVDLKAPPQSMIPGGYSLGTISETGLDDLFGCWLEVFAASSDPFVLGLDAQGRRDFFFESWRKEKPLIDSASLTLSHQGRLIGFSRLLPVQEPTDDCLMAPIGIAPEYRGRGLAESLLRTSMSRLRRLGYRTMSCYVNTNNDAAISLYKKLGLVSQSRIASLFGEIDS